jgi:O-acetyl-ADP-ribose deacetylase (regulator of RNase III)
MMIKYKTGDATDPGGSGVKIIVHCCNDIGKWGAGFVLALSRKWKAPEHRYRKLFRSKHKPQLGEVQFVSVGNDIIVANLIGQVGVRSRENAHPVRYDAIRLGMEAVAQYARVHGGSVHMPRIGCGLGGASWSNIEPIILDSLVGLRVYVYDLPR